MKWIIGEGAINAWCERWLGDDKLQDLLEVPASYRNVTARDLIVEMDTFSHLFPPGLRHLLSTQLKRMEKYLTTAKDVCVWMPTATGKFALSSA